jgi:membrane protein required for colicin V production
VVADVALVVLFATAFLLGVVRGALRQLITIGAWLVAFVLAAQVRQPLGDWIDEQTAYSAEYVDMLGFALAFVVLFGLALLVIQIGGRTVELIDRPGFDEVLGGVLALAWAVMAVTSFLIVLDTYYANAPIGGAELDLIHDINVALRASSIGQALERSAVPGLLSLLGPLLPADVHASVR